MSRSIAPQIGVSRPSTRGGFLHRLARNSVSERLQRLDRGALTISDWHTARTFGTRGDLQASIFVRSPRFWSDVALGGSLGAAESYVLGRWDADDLTALCRIFARNLELTDKLERGWASTATLAARVLHALRRNSRAGSLDNIAAHYDLGNDFFRLVLDETMNYSCAIFESQDETLAEASVRKMEVACRKLDLRPTDHLLEIGTGWGALAIHAAQQYGCRVTTATVSQEQFRLATQRVRDAGLSGQVEVVLRDYRDLEGRFDKLVSIEMIEAVGHEFLQEFFWRCSRLLAPDGLMLLQAILMAEHRYDAYRRSADFIQRYVFPGSCLLSMAAIGGAVARSTDMRMVHLEDLTPHYCETLRRWRENFHENLGEIRQLGYSEPLLRLWEFYLSYCEAGFAERATGDIQLLLAKPGNRREAISSGRGLA